MNCMVHLTLTQRDFGKVLSDVPLPPFGQKQVNVINIQYTTYSRKLVSALTLLRLKTLWLSTLK